MKKRFVEHMEKMDKQYTDNMTLLSGNMEKLTNSIADGFSLLRGMLVPQHPQPMYSPYQASVYNPHSPFTGEQSSHGPARLPRHNSWD